MSFVEYPDEHHFSYQNLPYGIFSTTNNSKPRPGVAIGDFVLDLGAVTEYFTGDLMKDLVGRVFNQETLNDFIALTPDHWAETRSFIKALLSSHEPFLRDNQELRSVALHPMCDVRMHLPVRIGDYTDFYASIDHARNIGRILRGPGQELQPNYIHLPVAYHGRASSVVVSGTPVVRPTGQILRPGDRVPILSNSRKMDFELEMGIIIGGQENPLSHPVHIETASKRLFGMVLLNDWSARDIQAWEYQPLGPFNSKNFATSISPWIVTFEALREFKTEAFPHEVLSYLQEDGPKDHYNIHLEVKYKPKDMTEARVVCKTNFSNLYWTPKQMVVHHTVGGCNLRPGDLLGTGTISGRQEGSFGSMMEISRNGRDPVRFRYNITRSFVQDDDEIILTGFCRGRSYIVGFGECTGIVLPSRIQMPPPAIVVTGLGHNHVDGAVS